MNHNKLTITILMVILIFPVAVNASYQEGSPWPRFGRNNTGQARSPYYTSHINGTEKWSFSTGDYVVSSPAVGGDGTVYVGSDDGNVYALNGSTGSEIWNFTTGGDVHYSSPAVGGDGTVYIGSVDGNVYALNGSDGSEIWNFTTGDGVDSSPAIGADGTVYIGSEDNHVYALDGSTGSEIWNFTTGNDVRSSPAIGSDGTIYIGSYDHNVYALTGKYNNLTTNSTTGGSVDDPGEGEFNYADGIEVTLSASSDTGYNFSEWTGDTASIADVNSPDTTITMNDDYSITANFQEETTEEEPQQITATTTTAPALTLILVIGLFLASIGFYVVNKE